MTMTSFLQRMIWRGGDNDRQNVTIAETQCRGEKENKKLTTAMSDWFENRSQSVSNISEVTAGRSRRPSTLRLFGNSRKFLSDMTSCESSDVKRGSKSPSTRLVENVVREFEDNYKSPTKTPSKKSKNFVKKLVAALERKEQDNDVDEVFSMRYSSGPIYAYENSGTIRKSETNHLVRNKTDDHSDEVKIVTDKTNFKAQDTTSSKTAPRIIGAFLKKPVEVDDTSIYWIPITGKKLPRKKSFKKLLAKLTGRNCAKRSEMKAKQVVFASQTNLIEEIHDSGYEGRSTCSSTSSLTSFADTLMYHDNNYVDKAYRDCNFSTFVTSSPLKKTAQVSHKQLVNRSKDLQKLFPEKETCNSEIVEIREDSGYLSNHSILEESMPKKNLVATRVQQISYQLSKLPKHPFARSEPRLYRENYDEHHLCGEIITLRRSKDEPVYDVPQPRPRSSIFDESLSMKRRNLPVRAVMPFGYSGYSVFSNLHEDEQPHYATVKPRNNRNRISYDNLCPNVLETPEVVIEDPIVLKESLHSSYADLTANESFVISMYV